MSERRCSKRVPKQIRIRGENGNVSFDGITSDICQDGVFIISNFLVPPKTIIDIELWYDESASIQCRGQVVWINRGQVVSYPAGFGVQFLDLTEEALGGVLSLCELAEELI